VETLKDNTDRILVLTSDGNNTGAELRIILIWILDYHNGKEWNELGVGSTSTNRLLYHYICHILQNLCFFFKSTSTPCFLLTTTRTVFSYELTGGCVSASVIELLMNTEILKVKAIPVQAWRGPKGSCRLRLPEFLDNRNMMMVRLSALRTGRLYPPGYWYSNRNMLKHNHIILYDFIVVF
jgi:hypothetical protein